MLKTNNCLFEDHPPYRATYRQKRSKKQVNAPLLGRIGDEECAFATSY